MRLICFGSCQLRAERKPHYSPGSATGIPAPLPELRGPGRSARTKNVTVRHAHNNTKCVGNRIPWATAKRRKNSPMTTATVKLKRWRHGSVYSVSIAFAVVSFLQAPAAGAPVQREAARVVQAPPIGAALIQTLLSLSKTRTSMTLIGISKFVGESLSLSVASNRSLIAYNNAVAVERGGRYAPPASLRADLLSIDCGDADLGEIFNCTRVAVKTAAGKVLRPITMRTGPQTFRNALGARWTAQTVAATYQINELTSGFLVDYAAADGTAWTLNVSATEARRDLLLTIDPQTGEADQCATRGNC
jgi:hypothetical protein